MHTESCCAYSAPLPADLDSCISAQRLGPYMSEAFNDGDTARELYLWNIELCSALYTDIALIEVALRNAMHAALSERYGERWYVHGPLLDKRTIDQLSESWKRIPKTLRHDPKKNAAVHGRLIANCMFGFWTGLLDQGGATGIEAPRDQADYDEIWTSKILRRAFKGLRAEARKSNGTASREWVYARVKEVHALRNRISHHEPLVNGFPLPGQMDENQTPLRLTAEQGHEACMRLARMLDIHLADWLATNSRVPALLRIRPDPQGCAQQPDCVTRP
ncbi:hypothetical protein [Mycolicibacterium conceptionense]|nr:hypothetical protein [Mycolicibacterium conceptionense]